MVRSPGIWDEKPNGVAPQEFWITSCMNATQKQVSVVPVDYLQEHVQSKAVMARRMGGFCQLTIIVDTLIHWEQHNSPMLSIMQRHVPLVLLLVLQESNFYLGS